MLLRLLFILIFLASPFSEAGELKLTPVLAAELNQVLRLGSLLHAAMVFQNEEQIEIHVREMIQQLARAKSASYVAKPHERGHLLRIIEAAREQLELTQTSYGSSRRERLEDAFNQLVNLVRTYQLDKAYSIYFCPKDKTTWIQRGTKARSPFHPSSREPCGIRVQH